jgi:REP element-mobilizing transposase RayT
MNYPRSHLIDPDGGTYHVSSRCVRRALLFGIDGYTGKDFSHRRDWIEKRILELSDVFTVSIYAYAVMSNHYHIVLRMEPVDLSDEEVADRWLKLCPGRKVYHRSGDVQSIRKAAILNSQSRLLEIRARLSSLSWFMRFINEPLARIANKEDCCKGRFWEGRFQSQALLDEASVLACMVYVDLNPIRAGLADDIEDSDFTSIQRRCDNQEKREPIEAINKSTSKTIPFSKTLLFEYINLIRWTATHQSYIRRGIQYDVSDCLKNNHTNMIHWFADHMPLAKTWQRAMGSGESLREYARSINQSWIRRRSLRS